MSNFLSFSFPALLLVPVFALAGWCAGLAGNRLARLANPPVRPPSRAGPLALALIWALLAGAVHTGLVRPPWLLALLVLSTFAVPLTIIDWRERRLPDVLTLSAYPALAAAVGCAAAASERPGAIWWAAAGTLVFGGLHLLVHRMRPAALGGGDVKLSGALGLVLGAVGWPAMVLATVLAAVVSAVLGLGARARGSPVRHGVPHGPGLLLATGLVLLVPGW